MKSPMFNRRHYEKVAREICERRAAYIAEVSPGAGGYALVEIQNDLADMFAADNPPDPKRPGSGFDREQFEKACSAFIVTVTEEVQS